MSHEKSPLIAVCALHSSINKSARQPAPDHFFKRSYPAILRLERKAFINSTRALHSARLYSAIFSVVQPSKLSPLSFLPSTITGSIGPIIPFLFQSLRILSNLPWKKPPTSQK